MHHQGADFPAGALLIAMQETAWDTALAPHPAGCCKDRAAARPDPCDGRGVGHFLRGPAGSGAIGIGLAAEGLVVWGSTGVNGQP